MPDLKKIKIIVAILSVMIAIASSSFINKKSDSKEYGFLYATRVNDTRYHYMVIDLTVLDSLKADYGCELDGTYCQIHFFIGDTLEIRKSGLHKEIIEFDCDPNEVKVTGYGFKFFYNYK